MIKGFAVRRLEDDPAVLHGNSEIREASVPIPLNAGGLECDGGKAEINVTPHPDAGRSGGRDYRSGRCRGRWHVKSF